jgi:hypothetical protein
MLELIWSNFGAILEQLLVIQSFNLSIEALTKSELIFRKLLTLICLILNIQWRDAHKFGGFRFCDKTHNPLVDSSSLSRPTIFINGLRK